MSSPSITFNHGVASGDPYVDSVILWTRVTPPQGLDAKIDGTWQASLSPGFEPDSIVDSGTFSTTAARDWTVKVVADGLKADTTYHYRFLVGDVESTVGQTKTLPVDSDAVRLAVFSCANFTAADTFAAYGRAAAINAVNPYDALVHLGDYIYEYGPGGYGAAEDAAKDRGFLPNREIVSLDDYRQRYAQYHTDQNLQALRAAAPLIAIWDDHETANDSWSGGAQNHQTETEGEWIARRDAALKAYYEWLPIREPLLRQGVDKGDASTPLTQGYRSFNFGDVLDLHVLETRLTARDEQLDYPDAAAVQARIGAILASPTDLTAYATRLGVTPPVGQQAIAAFAPSLAPVVTQELVIAAVQKAWGDPNRDLIGDTQLAWLQNQMGQSKAAWQVLGQQVLMQSMAVPAELLLNAGNLSLLDKYAAPLQKLATGTAFAELSAAEQALFAEGGKIPYNLDAWDGYGVERETILQTALAQGKRLISLAGDTHNAWAGVLDTMAPGSKPAGTVAGVEFATPGVTSPGLEKYFPGADGYIRDKYPSVDGLDGLFRGYVSGLKYADLNRRGFLELTVTAEKAEGNFQLLNGFDANSGASQWSSETVVTTRELNLSVNQLISWEPTWRELDLVLGVAVDAAGTVTRLNPASYASVPREGVQFADVSIQGSDGADRIFAGVGSLIDAAGGSDELFNTDSQGSNRLVGGLGYDTFYLNASTDAVIGGRLISDASGPRSTILYPTAAIIDQTPDKFYILSDTVTGDTSRVSIVDFEIGTDQAFIDGKPVSGNWQLAKEELLKAGVSVNAAPILTEAATGLTLNLVPGVNALIAPSATYGQDPDGDQLSLVVLRGPDWITIDGLNISINTPKGLKAEDVATLDLELGFYDGKAITPYSPTLVFKEAPPQPANTSVLGVTTPTGEVKTFALRHYGGNFNPTKSAQLMDTVEKVNKLDTSYRDNVTNAAVTLSERALNFEADIEAKISAFNVGVDLGAFINTLPAASKHLTYYSIDSQGKVTPLTYNPFKGGGARFYDRSGDGVADFVSLKLIDGGYGDKDGTVNGTIVDPSTVGTADLKPVLQMGALGILKASDPSNTSASANFFLKASLQTLPSSANQIGYLVLDESQVARAASLDLDTIRRQSQILFTTLENSDVMLPSSTTFTKDILLLNNQNVRFFEVIDGTIDQLTSAMDPRLSFFNATLRNQSSAEFSSSSGVSFILNLQDSNQGLSALIGQEQGTAAVLDFSSFTTGEVIRGTLHMGREASYDSITGFYRTLDSSGSVRTASGVVLRPEDAGYAAAAIRTENRVDSLSGLSIGNKQTSSKAVALSETSFLAPFAQVNGNTFFGFAAANTDKISHFRVLGTNIFGLEDMLGGGDRDFDDNVLVFKFDTIA
ncbi:alkaline phosphatase D family protein [Cyanobium sp. WKJ7-Wakatipu]|uniref:alkaline phosphatase D family protein n=1 Tax=Cyanobium sp. WKJ7-Wakatipu TaxID=2823726 RepID=UPI0020CC86E8|nr:alkaline phosphatase D family protein [Cyanobium sp. WKJ7-Wakatipu]MCP9782043.1 alkaline phosphatase D family protein [Cyanobium sp. WKJ7-Wakatipu]